MWYKIKRILVGTQQVRPHLRTFTIQRTEKSDMSSWWTYSDDAAWLTAWDSAFDDFFWYSAVLLNTSWTETAEMKQSWWVFSWVMSTLGNISSWDNVMIKFPKRWIKMTKSWDVVTLSITEVPNKDWYQYYAFQTWQTNNITSTKDQFYIWAYEWYVNSSVLKSWSWRTPTWSKTLTNFCTYAKANNNNLGWNVQWFYQHEYIVALYMMKYGNPNSQSVIWQWRSGWSISSTWWTDSQTSATYGTTSNTTSCRLFWVENFWWNIAEVLWWAYTDSNWVLYTQLSWYTWSLSWWVSTWITKDSSSTWSQIKWIAWNNLWMFTCTLLNENTSYNTYYCDNWWFNVSCYPSVWWAAWHWNKAWVINFIIFRNSSFSYYDSWIRLMYL